MSEIVRIFFWKTNNNIKQDLKFLRFLRAFPIAKIKNAKIKVNLLTTVLNDAPVQPEEDDEDTASLLKDSPQCVTFGLFMIW